MSRGLCCGSFCILLLTQMKQYILSALLLLCTLASYSDNYTNPILYEDYSDPDVIRVGEDYWMTASSFHCQPGLPILHSYDLVHWEVVNNAIKSPIPGGQGLYPMIEHGNEVWAPSIRCHKGTYYITWGDPDVGIWQVHTTNPMGKWSEPLLIVEAKGYIDACPFWDEDGHTYIVHALARSRAGMKSVLLLTETDEELTKVVKPSKIFFDGHETQPTCEGPKLYKKDGYYYVFFPAGGVATGWQSVIRSKTLDVWSDNFNPADWEEKIVMNQGSTNVNGPHQGGWVTTPSGEDWFIHFQDVGALGRILHLQPMKWLSDGWPVIGADEDSDGVGEPVMEYPAPAISKAQKALIKKSKKVRLGYYSSRLDNLNEWQWQSVVSNQDTALLAKGMMACRKSCGAKNLWQERQMVLKKIQGPDVEYTTQVIFRPKKIGDRMGFIVMGMSYAGLELRMEEDYTISLNSIACEDADKDKEETSQQLRAWCNVQGRDTLPMEKKQLFMRVTIHSQEPRKMAKTTDKLVIATFSYSTDSEHYEDACKLIVQPGKWIGAKVGYFCTSESDDSEGTLTILGCKENLLVDKKK